MANENLSCRFPSVAGIAPGVAPRVVVFVMLKSWDAIPRMAFHIPRINGIIFRIPRAALRIPRNSSHEIFLRFSGFRGFGLSDCRCARDPNPDPPILAFFDFFAFFFVFRFSLLFCAFFLPFPRISRVPRREKPLLFFRANPCFFLFLQKGWRVREYG